MTGTAFALVTAMPRGPRILPSEGVLHIICRGNNHIRLCQDPQDFKELKQRLLYYSDFYQFNIYHYTLMQTHLHLLAFIKNTQSLPLALKALQISYFHFFKKKYGYQGHLWHGRYRSIPILKETHFLQCGRYIELNPVRANIVRHPGEYDWTSYRFYARGQSDSLITPNPQYLEWGISEQERIKKYQKFISLDALFDYPKVSKFRGNVPYL